MKNRIRYWREQRGLSLQGLAERVGTSNQQISNLELGKRRLTTDWMERLAKALELEDPADLLIRPRGREMPAAAAMADAAASPVDVGVLQGCIQVAEELIDRRGRRLAADKKAALIAAFYQYSIKSLEASPADRRRYAEQLLRLVA